MSKKNVIIIGAAGRDFYNFNTYYRNNDAYKVVAFTSGYRCCGNTLNNSVRSH